MKVVAHKEIRDEERGRNTPNTSSRRSERTINVRIILITIIMTTIVIVIITINTIVSTGNTIIINT